MNRKTTLTDAQVYALNLIVNPHMNATSPIRMATLKALIKLGAIEHVESDGIEYVCHATDYGYQLADEYGMLGYFMDWAEKITAQPIETIAAEIATPAEMVGLLGDDEIESGTITTHAQADQFIIDTVASEGEISQAKLIEKIIRSDYANWLSDAGFDFIVMRNMIRRHIISLTDDGKLAFKTGEVAGIIPGMYSLPSAQPVTRPMPATPDIPDYFDADSGLIYEPITETASEKCGIKGAIIKMMRGYADRGIQATIHDFLSLQSTLQVSTYRFLEVFNDLINTDEIWFNQPFGTYTLRPEIAPVPVELLSDLQSSILDILVNGGAWSINGLQTGLGEPFVMDTAIALERLIDYGHIVRTEGGLYTLKTLEE